MQAPLSQLYLWLLPYPAAGTVLGVVALPALVPALYLSEESGVDHLTSLTSQGPLGVAVVVLGLFAKYAHNREAQRADRLEAEIRTLNEEMRTKYVPRELYDRVLADRDRLNDSVREKFLPALLDSAHATQAGMAYMQDIKREQDFREKLRNEGGRNEGGR